MENRRRKGGRRKKRKREREGEENKKKGRGKGIQTERTEMARAKRRSGVLERTRVQEHQNGVSNPALSHLSEPQ